MARRNLDGVGAIHKLEDFDFRLDVDEGGRIVYARHADWELAAEIVRPYLKALKDDKAAAVEFLKYRRAKHEMWLSAYEAWENDPDPANDEFHKEQIAVTAVVAQLPFYEDGESDSSPYAWYRWSKEG